MANQLILKANYCFCPMAKLNFLKNKVSNTWPSEGTMHVDLPQGLDDVTHRTKSKGGSPLRFRQWGVSSSYYLFPWRSGYLINHLRDVERMLTSLTSDTSVSSIEADNLFSGEDPVVKCLFQIFLSPPPIWWRTTPHPLSFSGSCSTFKFLTGLSTNIYYYLTFVSFLILFWLGLILPKGSRIKRRSDCQKETLPF